MERIKDLSRVKLRGDMLMCKIYSIGGKKSSIIMPEGVDAPTESIDYMQVISKGAKIDDVEIGDVVVVSETSGSQFEINGELYAIVLRHLCPIIVSNDNFEFKEGKIKE